MKVFWNRIQTCSKGYFDCKSTCLPKAADNLRSDNKSRGRKGKVVERKPKQPGTFCCKIMKMFLCVI